MSIDVRGDNALGSLPQFIVNNSTRAHISQSQSWHPKITPYRLVVISTTLCLGTVKAVLTQQGRSIAPITIEWIMSVVLVLVFQICGDYDSESRAPSFFPWFFTFDCMDITWSFLSLFSIRRPSYISDELESLPSRNLDHPPITLHRILFSSIILLFGMSKATIGYLGVSMVVTWLDWLLATIIMTSFYILGLYEFNSGNKWSPFFVHDRTGHVKIFNRMIVLFLSIVCSILLIAVCAAGLWETWYLRVFHNVFPSSMYLAYFFELCFNISFSSFLVYFLTPITQGLVGVVTYALPRAVKSVPLRLFRAVRSRIGADRSLPIPRLYFSEQSRPIFMHIVLHLLGVAGCVALSGSALGLASMMFIPFMETTTEVGHDRAVTLIMKFSSALGGIAGIVLIIYAFIIIRSMIRPFYSYRRPYPAEFYASLFNFS